MKITCTDISLILRSTSRGLRSSFPTFLGMQIASVSINNINAKVNKNPNSIKVEASAVPNSEVFCQIYCYFCLQITLAIFKDINYVLWKQNKT